MSIFDYKAPILLKGKGHIIAFPDTDCLGQLEEHFSHKNKCIFYTSKVEYIEPYKSIYNNFANNNNLRLGLFPLIDAFECDSFITFKDFIDKLSN